MAILGLFLSSFWCWVGKNPHPSPSLKWGAWSTHLGCGQCTALHTLPCEAEVPGLSWLLAASTLL